MAAFEGFAAVLSAVSLALCAPLDDVAVSAGSTGLVAGVIPAATQSLYFSASSKSAHNIPSRIDTK